MFKVRKLENFDSSLNLSEILHSSSSFAMWIYLCTQEEENQCLVYEKTFVNIVYLHHIDFQCFSSVCLHQPRIRCLRYG
jgi:hypothetical protein